MYKNLSFLLLPVIFSFTIDFIPSFSNISPKVNSVEQSPDKIKSISFYNNFEDYYNLTYQTNNLVKKKTKLLQKNIISTLQIHKDFEINYSAKIINNIYSQKNITSNQFIFDQSLNEALTQKVKYKQSEFKYNNILNFLELTSDNWKNSYSNKKIDFIETVLPLIAYENQKILLERQRLKNIKTYLIVEKTLEEKNILFLNNVANKYQIISKNKHKIDLVEELLIVVNVIPNSIALAQAANESGWGLSRFAKEYNALFGQYTYDEKKGIIPFDREEGHQHLIRSFTSFEKSVESYFKNINTHYAYKNFRKIRSQIKKEDLNLSVKLLTQYLDVYAEDKQYVDTINSIIDTNNFSQFDYNNQLFLSS